MLRVYLMIAALPAAGLAQDPERLAAAFEERVLLDQASRLTTDDRIALYSKLAEVKAENLHYHNLLAASLLMKMRETTDASYLARASRTIDNVLAQDSRNYEALRLRNEIELENHNFRRVAEASRELVKIAPQDPWNWGTLGDALMELGDYEPAAEAYQKMVALRPDLSSYNRAAWYRYIAGDSTGAIRIMRMAIEAGSRSKEHMAWCFVELGNLYLRTNQPAEASKAFTNALRYVPSYHPAHAGTGRAAIASGDLPGAIEAYRRAQSITPWPEYAAALHDLYRLQGKSAEAAKQLDLLDVADKLGQAAQEKANRSLAQAFADKDHRLPRALELAKAELAIRQDVFTWDTLAWALYKNNQYAEANAAIEKALRMGTPEAVFHYHAGLIAWKLDRKADAVKHLKRALELNPAFDPQQALVAKKVLEELS